LEKKQAEQELNMIKSEISDREVKNNNLNASMSSSAVLESLGRLKMDEIINGIQRTLTSKPRYWQKLNNKSQRKTHH